MRKTRIIEQNWHIAPTIVNLVKLYVSYMKLAIIGGSAVGVFLTISAIHNELPVSLPILILLTVFLASFVTSIYSYQKGMDIPKLGTKPLLEKHPTFAKNSELLQPELFHYGQYLFDHMQHHISIDQTSSYFQQEKVSPPEEIPVARINRTHRSKSTNKLITFCQTFGLHPIVVFGLFVIDWMLFGGEAATGFIGLLITIPVGFFLISISVALLQYFLYGDSTEVAIIKGLIAALIVVIPTALLSFSLLPFAVIGGFKWLAATDKGAELGR